MKLSVNSMPPIRKSLQVTDSKMNKESRGEMRKSNQTTTPQEVDYSQKLKPDLQAELKRRHLPISGPTSVLVARLQQHDHDSSIPAKQALEAAAQRRREWDAERIARLRLLTQTDGKPSRKRKGSLERSWARQDKLVKRGPTGPLIYDERGYELDYNKVTRSGSRRINKRSLFGKSAMEDLDRRLGERNRKAKFMGVGFERFDVIDTYLDHRVARDLAIPHHKLDMSVYKEWRRRGFNVDATELENTSKEDRDRVSRFRQGMSLSK